jgi:adenylyltransferase/sulfurtransferase
VAFSTSDVGRPKVEASKDRINQINPNVTVTTYRTKLTSDNVMDIFKEYDIIIDGTDNFPTRYLVNDACVFLNKPNIYGSIFRFEGQATVFWAAKGPCYRCLYPEPPPPGLVPSCAEGGVLGILPGLVGIIQATEVIKLILGQGDPLIGRLLLVDSLGMRFRELKLRKNPDCPVCGTHPTVTALIDYEQFCGIQPAAAPDAKLVNGIEQIDVTTFKQQRDAGKDYFLLDVREPHEFKIAEIGGYLLPLGDLQKRVGELDKNREIVVQCKSGGRSQKAAEFLQQTGFKVKNLAGGILAWSDQIDPKVPKY